MIVDSGTHPEKQLYYLGAKTLQIIDNNNGKVDFFEAYQELKRNELVSLMLFIHTLDWLYILGTVETEKGWIVKCS